MPSRKKAKGQARKAAKVKKEEAVIAETEKAREDLFRKFEQVQIRGLQINNHSSVPTTCMHGFDTFPDDHVCSKFIRAFVHEFYKCFVKIYKAGTEKNAERRIIESLFEAREVTKDEYSDVWNSSADKMKMVVTYFLHTGAIHILASTDGYARHSAFFARFFEEWLKVKIHKSRACIDWPKVVVSTRCDKRTLVKYFWRRIRCCCLDERYEEAKSIPKEGVCFNQQCWTVKRSELRCCSRCRGVTYCSRECQAADWSVHKEFCDEVAAETAEFDASQQQQS